MFLRFLPETFWHTVLDTQTAKLNCLNSICLTCKIFLSEYWTAVWQLNKILFCNAEPVTSIVILKILAGHLSDRIKFSAKGNESLLVLSNSPLLFAKTAF